MCEGNCISNAWITCSFDDVHMSFSPTNDNIYFSNVVLLKNIQNCKFDSPCRPVTALGTNFNKC